MTAGTDCSVWFSGTLGLATFPLANDCFSPLCQPVLKSRTIEEGMML